MADKKVNVIYTLKDKASKGLAKIGFATDKVGANLKTLGKVGIAVGGVISGIGFAVLRTAGKFEQWTIAFETMLGSAEAAKGLLQEITDFAERTPFELTGLVESSKQLLAFGIEAEKIIPTMESLGNIAAGVGTDKLPTLVRAFGKIRTKGRATMEELNMLLEAGVPILDELAKGYNVTKEELFKMISSGKVGFKDVEKALLGLSSGSGKFANLMEKQSQTFFGIISNIKDSLVQVALAMGNELLPLAKEYAKAAKDAFRPERIKAIAKTIKDDVVPAIISIIGFAQKSLLMFRAIGMTIGTIAAKAVILKEKLSFADPVKQALGFFERIKNVTSKIKDNIVAAFDSAGQGAQGEQQITSGEGEEAPEDVEDDAISKALGFNPGAELEKYRAFKEGKAEIDTEFDEMDTEKKLEKEEEEAARKAKELENVKKLNDEKLKQESLLSKTTTAILLDLQKRKDELTEDEKKTKEEMHKAIANAAIASANIQINSAEDFAKAAGNVLKDFVTKEIDMLTKAAIMEALASVPFPANLAAAALMAATGAAAKSFVGSIGFQEGGFVPGSSFSGDNIPINANSGEAVLTAGQQENLLSLASGGVGSEDGGGGGGDSSGTFILTMEDGTELAKGVYEKTQELLRTGEVS